MKKAVIGVGHGEKQQIHMMVKVLMPKAVRRARGRRAGHRDCHAHHRQSLAARLAAATGGGLMVFLTCSGLHALSNTLEVTPCA